jgi:hypothetical protein
MAAHTAASGRAPCTRSAEIGAGIAQIAAESGAEIVEVGAEIVEIAAVASTHRRAARAEGTAREVGTVGAVPSPSPIALPLGARRRP